MDTAKPSADWTQIVLGELLVAAGVYFALVGGEILPSPSKVNGPIWLAFFVAVLLVAFGIALIARGATGATDQSGDLPADAPVWLATVYWLASVMAAAALAGLGTWVAFGAGERGFSVSGLISGPVGDMFGRTVFGFGAILAWLVVAGLAYGGAKRIFRNNPRPRR